MKVKIIFVIALILSLICSASAIAAAEDITFDQSDIKGVSIETNDNLAISQENNENLKSVDEKIDFEDEKLSLNDEEILCENHTVEGNTFDDIKNKINLANDGDTIFLDGKNYTGNTSINFNKSNLKIIGGSSLDDDAISTLDANGLSRIMQILGNNVVIKGIKFINARSLNGGAIIWNGANGTIINCEFNNNTASGDSTSGGAIFWKGDNGLISNSKFNNNSASNMGGAVYCGAPIKIDSCNFTSNNAKAHGALTLHNTSSVINSHFTNNRAIGQDIGALSIQQNAANSTIENCTFTNNTAKRYVGAMKAFAINVKIINLTFTNNKAELNSGALSIAHEARNCTVDGCNFINNIAGGRGGAINWNGQEGTLLNSQFENNTGVDGGALYCDGNGAQIEGCDFTHNNASNGGAVYLNSNDSVIEGCEFNNNSADFGGAIHTVANNITVSGSNFTNNSAKFPGSDIWVDGPNNVIKNNTIDNSNTSTSSIHVTNNHNITVEGNKPENIKITYTEIVIEVEEKFIGHIGETLAIPVYIHDTIGDNLVGEVNLTDMEGQHLVNGRATFYLNITSNYTEPFMLVLTFEHMTRDIWIHPANPEKAIEDMTQPDDGNDTVIVKFPEDAKGNVTITVGDKNYTVPVLEGKAVIKINESLNGTYNATVFYSGDEVYKNMATSLEIIVKNSNITAVIEASDVISNINESIEIPVIVKNSIGDLMSGNVTIIYGGEETSQMLVDGKITMEIPPFDTPDKFTVTFRYGTIEKTIQIDVVDFKNPIEGISQAEGEDNTVIVNLPIDAKGNVSVVIGSKKYTSNVENGSAIVKVTDLPNGTYAAKVIYSGDDKYGNMTSDMEIVVKNSDVGVVIEASGKIANINETIEIPVTVKSSLGDLLTGEVTLSYGEQTLSTLNLVNGKATFKVKMQSVPVKLDLTVKYGNYTETIQIDVVDFKNPIEGISQAEGEDNTVIVNLPIDAKGNVSVVIGSKKYTANVENGSAIVKVTDLPNGTYAAKVIYSGDDKYGNMTSDMEIVVKNSDVGVVIEASGKIANINETIEIPVTVKSSLGDLLTGEVTLSYGEQTLFTLNLVNGKATFNVKMPSVPVKLDLTVKYGNYSETIQIDVVDFKNPIEGISQAEGEDNTVIVNLPIDAKGNVSVVIGSKKYAANVENGSAVVKVTDLPNGTYVAKVTYSGDDKYGNMTSYIDVIVKNSDVSVVIEASDVISNVNETIEIPVTVKSSLGDLLAGDVKLIYEGSEMSINKLVDGKTTFIINPISIPVKLEFTVKYGNYSETVQVEVVDPKNPIGGIEQPENGTDSVVVNLPSDAKGNVTVTVGDKSYTVPVVNGTAVVNITDLENGNYPAVITYAGDGKYSSMTQYITISIKNSNYKPVYKLVGKNIKVIFSGKAIYSVLVTKDGKAVVGEYVTINFNGKNTNVKTDAKGYATLKLNTKIKVKTYKISVTYKGISVKNNVKITQVIKASNKKVKKSKKVTKIKVSLKKVNGKYLKKKTLKIKFNKKTYKVKTNKKGVAIWKVKKSMLKKLKVGKKVKYTVTYSKAKLTKKLTIKK